MLRKLRNVRRRTQRFRLTAEHGIMAASKRTARSIPLFSLSARTARRAPRPDKAPTDERAHDDDGCVICVATRGGATFDWHRLAPSASGGPPSIDLELLKGPARKAMAKHGPAAHVAIPFFSYGLKQSDGTFAEAAFEVDGRGRLFWTTSTQRALIAQLPPLD